MIFDTHAHYDDEKFDEDRDGLISSLGQGGVGAVCNVSCNLAGLEKSRALAEKYDFFYFSAGVHPDDSKELDEKGMALLEEYCSHEKAVAVGEIGLDYYWDATERSVQKDRFAVQMDLARRKKLPVIIHSREAGSDTLDVMKAERAGDIGGVMHCYSYDRDMARAYLDMDFYFGIGGVVTFKNAGELKEVVKLLPMDRIVLETDCPYLAPVPFRGKRNSSLYIRYVIDEIAAVRGMDRAAVEEAAWENSHKLYRINRQR